MSQVYQCDKCLCIIEDDMQEEVWVGVHPGPLAGSQVPCYKLHLCPSCRDKWLRDSIPLMKRTELG